MKDLVFCVVDTETTGSPARDGHRVIEIGAIKIKNLETGETYQSLMNPGRKIDPGAQLVHGIKEEELASAPKPDQVISEFLEFIKDVDFLIAQNAQFDKEFLEQELIHTDPFSTFPPFLCTKKFSKLVFPFEKYHNLDVQTQRAGLVFEGSRHRALEDAIASANVFLHLLGKSPITDKDELIEKIRE